MQGLALLSLSASILAFRLALNVVPVLLVGLMVVLLLIVAVFKRVCQLVWRWARLGTSPRR